LVSVEVAGDLVRGGLGDRADDQEVDVDVGGRVTAQTMQSAMSSAVRVWVMAPTAEAGSVTSRARVVAPTSSQRWDG